MVLDRMQNDGLSISGGRGLETFVADANEVLTFKLLRDRRETTAAVDGSSDDDDDAASFGPEMTHQVYGDKESIFGYRGLSVKLWMTAASLKAYVKVSSDETVGASEGVDPDPVLPPLVKVLAPGQLTENLDEFLAELEGKAETEFVPFGQKVAGFGGDEGDSVDASGSGKVYEIYHCDASVPGFKAYHRRLQPWLLFFIDAASFIDDDDAGWQFFVLYEKYKSSEGRTRYAVGGYATVYQYYAYPEHTRPRISQVLVLPPFQKRGLGAKLVDTMCKFYWNNPKVVDITVEDPNDDFIRLRDYVDVVNALKRLDTMSSLEKVRKGFNEAMVREAKEKLKLGKKQTRRVYEIIRLYWVKKTSRPMKDENPEFKAYRIEVKKRLNIPFQKEKHQMEKLKKALKPDEFKAATINLTNREQRLESLKNQYKELMEHYEQILDRFEAS